MKWQQFLDAKDNFNESIGSYFEGGSENSDVVLLISFLRHSGCTYCREMLDDLHNFKKSVDTKNIKFLVVHMSTFTKGEALLKAYGLEGTRHISDPQSELYNIFNLSRGSLSQLFGVKSILRGFKGIAKYGIGLLDGDGMQMPGVFLVNKEGIIKSFVHKSAADRVDYSAFLKA